MNKMYFALLFIGFFLHVSAAKAEISCGTPPTCAELGYEKSAASCNGKAMIKCPFDQSKVFCDDGVVSCASLGFTDTAIQCSGHKMIKCPFDTSKVICDMSNVVGEIRAFARTAPSGWMLCNGNCNLMRTVYSELYTAIGTTFGGTSSMFCIPDLMGRTLIGTGQRVSRDPITNLNTTYNYSIANTGGYEKITLITSEMPSHTHTDTAPSQNGNHPGGSGGFDRPNGSQKLTTGATGGGSAHENRMPYMAVYYYIYTGV